MAAEADFGLMIWDGRSAGTVLNLLRLAKLGKKAVLYDTQMKKVVSVGPDEWFAIFDSFAEDVKIDVRERATLDEWSFQDSGKQRTLCLAQSMPAVSEYEDPDAALPRDLNSALDRADSKALLEILVSYERITSSKRSGEHARFGELLKRALTADDKTDVATIAHLLSTLGLQLKVAPVASQSRKP